MKHLLGNVIYKTTSSWLGHKASWVTVDQSLFLSPRKQAMENTENLLAKNQTNNNKKKTLQGFVQIISKNPTRLNGKKKSILKKLPPRYLHKHSTCGIFKSMHNNPFFKKQKLQNTISRQSSTSCHLFSKCSKLHWCSTMMIWSFGHPNNPAVT